MEGNRNGLNAQFSRSTVAVSQELNPCPDVSGFLFRHHVMLGHEIITALQRIATTTATERSRERSEIIESSSFIQRIRQLSIVSSDSQKLLKYLGDHADGPCIYNV